ncbi:ABC transporter ATP-binding protein [Halomonas halocynthiae]|uniref:ABC transporter ATP-binding protein n=1 Tax=Halomonas halocynthiae TaxID=176290 RepID=UPI0004148AE2|nr:ABC transporter ATP-binding protein [Halomonas halocynthiae]
MIEVSGLYKRYHRQRKVYDWVLEDINLSFPKGVSVGLLGRNGAGKSTLLRLIAGMDTPDRGTIQRNCRVSWPIGLAGGFQGSMTGRQNVKFVARVQGGDYNVTEVIRFVQEFAELGDSFDEPIKTYSSGMRARLNFGLSLAFDFDVYLSDEATAVGDRAFRAKATKAFKDKVGKSSLIMVSHSEGILKDLCQAGVYLKDGSATWYDDINDAIAAYHEETSAVKATDSKPAVVKASGTKPQEKKTAPEPQTLAQAQQQRKQRRAEFDKAKTAFEQAKADELPSQEQEKHANAFKTARKRLHQARQRVEAMKPPS